VDLVAGDLVVIVPWANQVELLHQVKVVRAAVVLDPHQQQIQAPPSVEQAVVVAVPALPAVAVAQLQLQAVVAVADQHGHTTAQLMGAVVAVAALGLQPGR
jgi:hypothetical protein